MGCEYSPISARAFLKSSTTSDSLLISPVWTCNALQDSTARTVSKMQSHVCAHHGHALVVWQWVRGHLVMRGGGLEKGSERAERGTWRRPAYQQAVCHQSLLQGLSRRRRGGAYIEIKSISQSHLARIWWLILQHMLQRALAGDCPRCGLASPVERELWCDKLPFPCLLAC